MEKEGLERYHVLYLRSKYQYKSTYPRVEAKNNIIYAGPVEPMSPIWLKISDIIRKSTRICTESRRELKALENIVSKDFAYFKRNGITHIIIYKCLEK